MSRVAEIKGAFSKRRHADRVRANAWALYEALRAIVSAADAFALEFGTPAASANCIVAARALLRKLEP